MSDNRKVDRDSATKLTLVALSPITFEVAREAYGGEPDLVNDQTRAGFFAVWAMLRIEFADAVIKELHDREIE